MANIVASDKCISLSTPSEEKIICHLTSLDMNTAKEGTTRESAPMFRHFYLK